MERINKISFFACLILLMYSTFCWGVNYGKTHNMHVSQQVCIEQLENFQSWAKMAPKD